MKIMPLAAATLIALAPGSLWAECTKSDAPEIAGGSTTDKDAFIASYQSGRAYISETEAFLSCLEAEEKAEMDAGETTEESQAARLERYNAAVDELQQFSEQLNAEVREFKAANPG